MSVSAYIDYYHNYSYDIWESYSTTIYFPDKSGVGGVSFPANSISLNDPVIKAWEYGMVLYFVQISYPKYQFFLKLTKFQQCMFRRIDWVLTSPEGPTEVPVCRCLNLEVCSALIEYKNRKVKPFYCLISIVDYDDLEDQRQELVYELPVYLLADPALSY